MINIINKEVEKAAKILSSGGVIVYPTDTVWGPNWCSTALLKRSGPGPWAVRNGASRQM